jgi:hypothetical protein
MRLIGMDIRGMGIRSLDFGDTSIRGVNNWILEEWVIGGMQCDFCWVMG